ncbi:MAG: hypothetical protein JWN94_309 [Betaproteobacteria bacterium]|nr:hypothetical protein [Betaproteobacteria bacterium]
MVDASQETAAGLQNQGMQLRQSLRYQEAERCLLRALELEHDFAPAHLELGSTYFDQGRLEDAADSFQLAVHFAPRSLDAWLALGSALSGLGRTDAAIAAYRKATVVEPHDGAAWLRLGGLFKASDDWNAAIDCYRQAVGGKPASADALCLLGYALYKSGHYDEARERLAAALALRPDMVQAHHNLGLLVLETGQPGDALAHFERALAINPGIIETHACVAHALRDLGRFDDAIANYDHVLALDPDFADAVINRSYALLMKGDYAAGWDAYERRFNDGQPARSFRYPPWKGESIAGKRVLVYAEQGLGDEIMFASCIPDLLSIAGDCVIECNTRIASLFARSFPKANVHGGVKSDKTDWLNKVPPIDCQVSIGSLPRYFRPGVSAFSKPAGYLVADRDRVTYWRKQFERDGDLQIGIAWRGGTLRSRQFVRSIPLQAWAQLLSVTGAQFNSLQYGEVAVELEKLQEQSGVSVVQLDTAIHDIDELAAVLGALDLVITVDNTVAHLAGALGIPVWTLLPSSPEWRYPRSGETMSWYPSMRLFRCAPGQSWEPVMAHVASELALKLRGRNQP